MIKERSVEDDEERLSNGQKQMSFEQFQSGLEKTVLDKKSYEENMLATFALFDKDRKGYLDEDDLKRVFDIVGEEISGEDARRLVELVGNSSEGRINFKEFSRQYQY